MNRDQLWTMNDIWKETVKNWRQQQSKLDQNKKWREKEKYHETKTGDPTKRNGNGGAREIKLAKMTDHHHRKDLKKVLRHDHRHHWTPQETHPLHLSPNLPPWR